MKFKPGFIIAVYVVVFVFTCGMTGFGGGDVPTRIPTPDKNFAVTLTDRADVRTEMTMFSIGGYTHFFGQKGKGQLAVPFELIKRADFRQIGDNFEVVIQLKDGQTTNLAAGKKQDCYGRTSLGNFQITLGDVKSIVFGHQILTPEAKK